MTPPLGDDGEALELEALAVVDDLHVPDDPLALAGDQDVTGVEVAVEHGGGVLGEREERPQRLA